MPTIQILARLALIALVFVVSACYPPSPVDDRVQAVSQFVQCDQDGCTWNDDPPLPPPVSTCTSRSALYGPQKAMQMLVAYWIRDSGNGCFINENVNPPKLTLYGGSQIRASWEIVRQYFIDTYGANHPWSLDVDRIGYDFCKKVGHDSLSPTVISDPGCPSAARIFWPVRYFRGSQIGRAQRAREELFIRLAQPWRMNDGSMGCPPNTGETCAYVDPNYVSQATTGPVILNGVQAAQPAMDAWKTPDNATVVYGSNCALGETFTAYPYPGAPAFTLGDQGYVRLQCPSMSPICTRVQAIAGTSSFIANFQIAATYGSNMANCVR